MDLLAGEPHRRYDPLRDAWVLVSPGRANRPWAGAVELTGEPERAAYDPDCFLCPGNRRASGETNPEYGSIFVFTNDFAALHPSDTTTGQEAGILRAQNVSGTCRVMCFSPRHDLAFGDLAPDLARMVIDSWADQTTELGASYPWVQVFENRGAQMGASSPHPHGQVWAIAELPSEAEREAQTQRAYTERTGRPLLTDYATQEAAGPRVVLETEHWLVVVPFWAVWPFETLVLPRDQVGRLADLAATERDGLAAVLQALVSTYDRLFGVPFPYSMGWHQAPFGPTPTDSWVLHAHYYPPLLRSASVRKYMVGYELLAEPQRDLTAEEAAERLRGAG